MDSVSLHDGKWLNGSDINGQYVQEQHQAVLNILCKDTKIVFGHVLLNKEEKRKADLMSG